VVRALAGAALCWGSAPQAELLELAEVGARHGFRELSVTPGQYLRAGLPDAQLRARLADRAVTVGVIDALMSVLPGTPAPQDVRPQWREPFERSLADCLAAAVGLGARTVNMAHFLGVPTPVDDLAAAVRDVADAAAELNLAVSIEFIPGTGIPDLAMAQAVVAATGRPNVGILFDTWHFFRGGGTLADMAALRPGEVIEAQISDRVEPPDGAPYVPMTGRLPPGEGTAPLAPIVRALRQATPGLVLGVEVFTAEQGAPDAVIAALAATTEAFLEQL
jgi:sugar phosphate isomerase/epimerase